MGNQSFVVDVRPIQQATKTYLAALIDATNKACQAAKADPRPGYIVNWSNFHCSSAEFYMNEFGSFGYRVYVEEAEPTTNIALAQFISDQLTKAGFEATDIICEW